MPYALQRHKDLGFLPIACNNPIQDSSPSSPGCQREKPNPGVRGRAINQPGPESPNVLHRATVAKTVHLPSVDPQPEVQVAIAGGDEVAAREVFGRRLVLEEEELNLIHVRVPDPKRVRLLYSLVMRYRD